jgi:hypothetical protein
MRVRVGQLAFLSVMAARAARSRLLRVAERGLRCWYWWAPRVRRVRDLARRSRLRAHLKACLSVAKHFLKYIIISKFVCLPVLY